MQLPFTGYGVNWQLPYYQLERLEPNPVEGNYIPFDKMVGSTSPLIKLPVGLASNKLQNDNATPEELEENDGRIPYEYIYTGMPVDSPLEYLLKQTTLTGLPYDAVTNDEGELKEPEYWGLNDTEWSRFLAFPYAEMNDVTINRFPLYDINTGEYIGGRYEKKK